MNSKNRKSGVSVVEYSLLAALIASVSVIGLTALGTKIQNSFQTAADAGVPLAEISELAFQQTNVSFDVELGSEIEEDLYGNLVVAGMSFDLRLASVSNEFEIMLAQRKIVPPRPNLNFSQRIGGGKQVPPGLRVDNDGFIRGTATELGTFTFDVAVSAQTQLGALSFDLASVGLLSSNGEQELVKTVTINVVEPSSGEGGSGGETDPPLTIALADSSPSPLEATVGESFSFDFSTLATLSGGPSNPPAQVSDLTWSIGNAAAPLPSWASLDSTTGVVSGTPDAAGSTSFEMVGSYLDGEGRRVYVIDVGGVVIEVVQISAGHAHTCAVTTSGGAKCWGSGSSGRLGNGSTSNALIPVDVVGLTSGVAWISAGTSHTCAVTTSGGAKCWGIGSSGQLGDGGIATQLTPVDVIGLTSGVASISAGGSHTCAVTTSGGAKCWGQGGSGRLGNGSTTNQLTPVDVTDLTSGVASISAGGLHTCAVTTSGGAKCWGSGGNGRLGNNSTSGSLVPVNVSGLTSNVVSISAGGLHTCAVTAAGGVKCWGTGSGGRLGNGGTVDQLTPVDVTGLTSGAASISAGGSHTCAVTTSGGAKCWGSGFNGQLGNGDTAQQNTPVDVTGLTSDVTSISAGGEHTCAVTTTGRAKCWGSGFNGRLGNGDTANQITPVDVVLDPSSGGSLTISLADSSPSPLQANVSLPFSFDFSTLATLSGNSFAQPSYLSWSIGNAAGPLPSGLSLNSATGVVSGKPDPDTEGSASFEIVGSYLDGEGRRVYVIEIGGIETIEVVQISSGGFHTCAVTTSGGAKCWGWGANGRLGNNSTSNSLLPVDVIGLTSGVVSISAGGLHTCAVTTSGGAKCWGAGGNGRLGNGGTVDQLTPVDVTGLTSGVASISSGNSHTCAVTTSGGAKCWGWGSSGQLGNNSTSDSLLPVDVSGMTSGVASISSGDFHTCAVTTSGGAKCWGSGGNGRLGNNSTSGSLVPVDVSGLTSNVASISTGREHTCAVTTSGGAKCWGRNLWGQLGDGTESQRTTPVDVSGLTSGVASISSGNSHTCAVTTSGGAKCWGNGGNGRLGDGSTSSRSTPVDVTGLTSGVAAISAGDSHTCAMTTSGGAKCWGLGTQGQLGNGDTAAQLTPGDVLSLP